MACKLRHKFPTPLAITIADVKSLDFTAIRFSVKLFKSANKDISNDCLLHFRFSLPSELILIQERKEEFVSKFAGCHNLLWLFGTDFINLRLFFLCICCNFIW